MTVVAGCNLFNGVMLLAGCRATVRRIGGPIYAVDRSDFSGELVL